MRSLSTKIAILFMALWVSNSFGQEKHWWKESVFYQIYMPSYADSGGDGYGDFKGITQKLDHIKGLGIKCIWLTPFLKSPKVDNGYDVADYYTVDPTYGTMEDFQDFLYEAHKRDINVIMDMVVNHTSTECEWFKEAQKSKDNYYRDYYIWKDNPNNWESFFGGTAWQLDETTNQYYYHKFDVSMADLNWSNPKVIAEIEKVLKFWLEMGVDGFRFDVINFLTTDGILQDNPMKSDRQEHLYDINQPGIKNALKKLKAVVNSYPNRFTVGEIGSDKIDVLKQYQSPDMMDVVFNFNFGSIPEFSAEKILGELHSMEKEMEGYPTLFFGSHDMPRMMDRLAGGNEERALALATLMLTAKGVPFIYFGEEIGMKNIVAKSYDDIVDIQGKTHYRLAKTNGKTDAEALVIANGHNRDKSRGPMQWDASANSGFTTGKPWIKVHPDYKITNVAVQSKVKTSLLNEYKKLIALRNNTPVLQYGQYTQLEFAGDRITFTRSFEGSSITVIINFGKSYTPSLPKKAKILAGNKNLRPNSYLIYNH
ncbi:alpha-glucosidase [Flavobacterium sp. MFBS3-15]|uniref:alpha-glucosidase n=1 Tax=Flavobacterium sp. MFBS3-15 TaxID=2989816 RepID=UPI002236805F|nr:alpha-glucosidase [Flavobacterium sp. MFBS3-15]MCW4469666.1 alpha-glucosidase [Flavobacterium sp. MFBS3-15]